MHSTGLGALLLSTFSFGLSGIPALVLQFTGDVLLYGFVATQIILIYYIIITNLNPKIESIFKQ